MDPLAFSSPTCDVRDDDLALTSVSVIWMVMISSDVSDHRGTAVTWLLYAVGQALAECVVG